MEFAVSGTDVTHVNTVWKLSIADSRMENIVTHYINKIITR
jgi:hypothetical protein